MVSSATRCKHFRNAVGGYELKILTRARDHCRLKIFKFLDHKPEMSILQRTLDKAAGPLGWFMGSFVIVLLGSAQGFYMAFGLDLAAYRSTYHSIFSLLRMAVGDFDYAELENSHQILGPTMFFLYIVLVFFVLMSMFIALISEAYDAARDERTHLPAPRMKRRGYGSLFNVTREAEKRVDMVNQLHLISAGLYKQLNPFLEALPSFKERAGVVEELNKLHKAHSAAGHGGVHLFGGVPEALNQGRTRITQKLIPPGSKTALWLNQRQQSRLRWTVDQFKATAERAHGARFRTLEHNHGIGPNELSFRRNDIICVTERSEHGRWRGFRLEDGPSVSGEFDPVLLGNELKSRLDGLGHLDASSSDEELHESESDDNGDDDGDIAPSMDLQHPPRAADGSFDDAMDLGHERSSDDGTASASASASAAAAAAGDRAIGRAMNYAAELKTAAETSSKPRRAGRDGDPTRASPAKKRSAVMLEMETSAVAERRYAPSASTAQNAQSLTMHDEDLLPLQSSQSAQDEGSETTEHENDASLAVTKGNSLQVDAVKQKLSALALSVVPDMQELLQLTRAQQIDAQQATRAQLALAEEVQQLRHELRVLSAAFDRRVPEPPEPGAGWKRMIHEGFRSPEFPNGREYWVHDDGTTSWSRPPGLPDAIEEMEMRKKNQKLTNQPNTSLPGEVR
jgi:hypothetical protein